MESDAVSTSLLLFSSEVMSDSFAVPWTVAYQAPLSMGFPRQEYWSGLPLAFPADLPCISCTSRWIPYPGATGEASLHVDTLQNSVELQSTEKY